MSELIPAAETRRLCGGIKPMTEWRWRRAGILPQPIQIRGRNYDRRNEIEAILAQLPRRGETAVTA